MLKITFMGAGSTVFARNVLGDVMCTPALRQCEIALYDIDTQRLKESLQVLTVINANVNENRREPERCPAGCHFRGQRHSGGRLRALHRH